MKKSLLAFSISLVLSHAVYAATPATTTVSDEITLAAHNGEIHVENLQALELFANPVINYSGDININYKLTNTTSYGARIFAIARTVASLGKTTLVADIDSGANANSVSGLYLMGGSIGVGEAEFAANSSVTLNGNNQTRLYGALVEGGINDIVMSFNENTTIRLNQAGNDSRALFAYLENSNIVTQDGLLIEMNSDNSKRMYGITAEGWTDGAGNDSLGGEIHLNGTTTINLLNGGNLATAINAYFTGSKITSQGVVNISNITNDASAGLYGLSAIYGGSIELADTVNITLKGGRDTSSAIDVQSGSSIVLTGANIDVDSKFAMAASGAGSSIIGNEAKYNLNSNIYAAGDGVIDITMADGSVFNGVTLLYDASIIDLTINGSQSIWNMGGDYRLGTFKLSNLSLNGSTLSFNAPVTRTFTPTTLTVEGNYAGNDATLVLNTVLGDDNSLTDKLIVQGDVEAGTTNVVINNIGGGGAETINGIQIVEVGGQSIGEFVQQNRIVAGAYDYDVVKGTADESWYLSSHVTPIIVNPKDPQDPKAEQKLRPEFSSYLANNFAANTMFVMRLHDRLGETQYTDVLTGEQKVTSMWMRHIGGHTRFKDSSGQQKTQSNRYVAQIGGDLAQWSSDGLDRWHLGAMAGYGNSHSNTSSHVVNRESRSKVEGYSAGLYGTWYANQMDKTGTYIDTWVLYNWFDNEVSGDERATESYKSRGITASIEAGYSFKFGESDRDSYWIQPKAQVIWMDVQAKNHYEQADVTGARTKVSDKTKGNLQTRLGLRAYINGHNEIDDGNDRKFQPFVEANWIHNTNNYSVQMADVKDEMRGTKNIGELKVGVEGQLSKRLNVWGNAAQQIGDKGYSDTSATIGIKYQF